MPGEAEAASSNQSRAEFEASSAGRGALASTALHQPDAESTGEPRRVAALRSRQRPAVVQVL